MIKKLVILSSILIGVFALFQTSKLIGTILERSLFTFRLDTEIEQSVQRPIWEPSGLRYDDSILSSPLFSVSSGLQVQAPGEEGPLLTESPLLKKYELNGVILISGRKSIALIRRAGQRESEIYRKGDRLDNAEIIKIERDRVLLNDGRNTIVLPMYYRYMNKTARASPVPAQEKVAAERFSDAKEIKKVLSRSDVETKVFQKVNELLTQIAISPYMNDGKMEGLRLVRVPRNNIVYELGGRSGDILRRVNGHEINQIDQMYKLWDNIKDDSFISVDLERNNQIFTYSFDIRD